MKPQQLTACIRRPPEPGSTGRHMYCFRVAEDDEFTFSDVEHAIDCYDGERVRYPAPSSLRACPTCIDNARCAIKARADRDAGLARAPA